MAPHAGRAVKDEPPPKRRGQSFNHGNTRPVLSRTHDDYHVGWICALPIETAAAKGMLDETHPPLPNGPKDTNTYTLGSMSSHNIVVASLPSGHYGTNNAATVANNMTRTYPSINIRLMVGIGGGTPLAGTDLRLGDVVVSDKVLQHDFGKIVRQGILERTGAFTRPPQDLLTAVTDLKSEHELKPSRIPELIDEMVEKYPNMSRYARSEELEDHLYDTEYEHVGHQNSCDECAPLKRVSRRIRTDQQFHIHHGVVASGNQVLKHAPTRDRLARELNILCFEMESAGLIDSFPCLVIRGICDYCDSHKNKSWQKHAAAVAAAYAKELLAIIPPTMANSKSTITVEEKDMESAEMAQHLQQQHILWKGLAFQNIKGQQSSVKKHNINTCKWLLDHEDYLDWLDRDSAADHHGFFWIRGKPGAGKSTLMNFLFKESLKDESCITISFFFNARGDYLERSTIGMYRSALYQLLEATPELLPIFNTRQHKFELERIYESITKSHDTDVSWSPELLQSLLSTAVNLLGSRRLAIFIDALDECQDDDVAEMIDFFQDLGESALTLDAELRICFSSRHYPHIDIDHGHKIALEDQGGHKADIYTYVRSKLMVGRGKSKLAAEIETKITDKASGVFIWVVLVVQILNNEYKDGRIHEVRKRLDAIPSRLSDVFRDILNKDNRNMDDFRLCVMWIMFARSPLSLEEFYFAAVSGLSPDSLDAWDKEETTGEDMARYVLSSSRGLAEVTASTLVQFIHESVREFFLKDGIRELWPDMLKEKFEDTSHTKLAQCCLSYFRMDSPSCPMHDEHDQDSEKLLSCPVAKFYPFLVYSTQFGLWHLDRSGDESYQVSVLSNLRLCDWLLRLNLTVPRGQVYGEDVSFLYVLADMGLPALIRLALNRDRKIDVRGGYFGFPLFAALGRGHTECVKALLYHDRNPATPDVMTELLAHGSRFITTGQTPLAWAAACGFEEVLEILLSIDGTSREAGRDGRTPLSWAAANGHLGIVKRLMEESHAIDVNKTDHQGRTPLGWAAVNRNHAIVSILLAHPSIDVNIADFRGKTPLSLAATIGHASTVRQLLSSPSIKVDRVDDKGRTPLWWAAYNGRMSVVEMLLSTNAVDVNISDDNGRTSLWWATFNNHGPTVSALLTAKSIDVNTKDRKGTTALLWAVANMHDAIAQELLVAGGQVDDEG